MIVVGAEPSRATVVSEVTPTIGPRVDPEAKLAVTVCTIPCYNSAASALELNELVSHALVMCVAKTSEKDNLLITRDGSVADVQAYARIGEMGQCRVRYAECKHRYARSNANEGAQPLTSSQPHGDLPSAQIGIQAVSQRAWPFQDDSGAFASFLYIQ